MVELFESDGIQVAKQARRIVIPTPPQVSSQRPQPFKRRSDETIERACFTYDGRDLCCGFHEHPDSSLAKDPGSFRLNHEDTLKDAAIDERDAKKRVKLLLTRLPEIFKPRMILCLFHGNRPDLLRHQAC